MFSSNKDPLYSDVFSRKKSLQNPSSTGHSGYITHSSILHQRLTISQGCPNIGRTWLQVAGSIKWCMRELKSAASYVCSRAKVSCFEKAARAKTMFVEGTSCQKTPPGKDYTYVCPMNVQPFISQYS